ncbi:DUF5324 family protein [Streptomyces sp. TP-A0874]|uniref:DUF5324 family protein n=1 Tax=Streptomyces sp. TP-A0874 TaxID=549819 RepID=UPI000853AE95|nr:DUF5324 family protein [Streptomyces sp. TP-A0874]
MTRLDSVRAATDTARESVLHAAEVVAPYAGTAKDQAAHYAREAGVWLAPRMARAARQARGTARAQYVSYLRPRVRTARGALPPQVDMAAQQAVYRTRAAARQAADYTVPRVEQAIAASEPVREEAMARSAAAVAALRGKVTPKEIRGVTRRRACRATTGRMVKGMLILGAVAGGAALAWKWWERQSNPDWLVEPPAATELGERTPLTSVDGAERGVGEAEARAQQNGGERAPSEHERKTR